MISALFLAAEGLAQLGCGVLVRSVAALWTLSLVSPRLLVRFRRT